MNQNDIDALVERFFAASPQSCGLDSIAHAQATVLVSMVSKNAPVLAKEWNLPQPRADLSNRINDDTVESHDISEAFAATWALTSCGYFIAGFYKTGAFTSLDVELNLLQQVCEENSLRLVGDLLTGDLEQVAAKCTTHLAERYLEQEHLSNMLNSGTVQVKTVFDLIEKSILAGIFVWEMSEVALQRMN